MNNSAIYCVTVNEIRLFWSNGKTLSEKNRVGTKKRKQRERAKRQKKNKKTKTEREKKKEISVFKHQTCVHSLSFRMRMM